MSERKAKLDAKEKISVISIIEASSDTSIESSFSDLPRSGDQFQSLIDSFRSINMENEDVGETPRTPLTQRFLSPESCLMYLTLRGKT